MNKRLLVALVPLLIQAGLYCNYIDQMVMPQLQSAQATMHSNTALHLPNILTDLVNFGKKSDKQATQAVECMKSIKGTLAHAREEEQNAWSKGEKTWWDWFVGNQPKKVVEEIDPAIDLVDKALNDLGTYANKYGYTIAATAATTVLVAGLAAAAAWYINSSTATTKQEYLEAGRNYAKAGADWVSTALNTIRKADITLWNSLHGNLITVNKAKINAEKAITQTEMNSACKSIESSIDTIYNASLDAGVDLGKKPEALMLD